MGDVETAREWLARAEDDHAPAGKLTDLGHVALGAFHAQQAAEKALKSVLIARGAGLEKTHDLNKLGRLAKAPERVEDCASYLTGFYLAGRYPDSAETVTAADARESVLRSEEVLRWCRQQIS